MKLSHEMSQLHFFTNNADIEAKPQQISKMLDVFAPFQLVPTYGNELNTSTGEKRQFVVMVSADESVRVEFSIGRIVVIVEGKSLDEFYEYSGPIMQKLKELFPDKKASRLSIVNTRIYEGSEDDYKSLYDDLFTYRSIHPFEWDNRVAERKKLDKINEEINYISTIRKCRVNSKFIKGGEEISGILSEIDVNTIPENTGKRFDFDGSVEIFDELKSHADTARNLLSRYFD